MQSTKYNRADPSSGNDYENLGVINGVRFTPREVDIIACLLSGKLTKTVARFLSIEEKTVETHKYNIMRKVGCNAKGNIIDFIEKSDKFADVKKHYLDLLIQFSFKKHLHEILTFTGKNNPICCLVYGRQPGNQSTLINWLETCLKLAGIRIRVEAKENYKSPDHLLHQLESQTVDYIFYLLSSSRNISALTDTGQESSETLPFIQKL